MIITIVNNLEKYSTPVYGTPSGSGREFLTLRGNTSGHGALRQIVDESCFQSGYVRFPCCSLGARGEQMIQALRRLRAEYLERRAMQVHIQCTDMFWELYDMSPLRRGGSNVPPDDADGCHSAFGMGSRQETLASGRPWEDFEGLREVQDEPTRGRGEPKGPSWDLSEPLWPITANRTNHLTKTVFH